MNNSRLIPPSVPGGTRRQQLKPFPAPVARKPGDTSPSMVCQPIFEELCIHANGDIVCWSCDANGQHVYGNVFADRIADVYNGPGYRAIREWQLQSRPDTWCPAVDRHCPLRVVPATTDQDTRKCRVKILKLEPVTYCNIHCPVCPVETAFKQIPAVRERRANKLLPLETMLDVVAQLPDLETILYFDYGEPFLHKDTIPFLREVRRTRPRVEIVTNTNGLVITPAQIKALATEALMDRVVFSIDGATPDSYRKYRVGGTFSKAVGKMKALADACREAGTWRKYVTGSRGRVQITWQYILFEWNDSDEELALARQLARYIDVPIEWVITSGYGASKRFLHGSAEAARLMDPPEFFIHMAANADIENRLKERGIGAGGIHVYNTIQTSCELQSYPYAQSAGWRRILARIRAAIEGSRDYRALIRADDSSITAPVGSTVLFDVSFVNRTGQTWDLGGSNYLRLGVLLKTATGETVRELPGAILPPGVAHPGERDSVPLRVTLPDRPGHYKLIIDVVQEGVCWFSDNGSPPLECSLSVE
jgi:hypothetical protein